MTVRYLPTGVCSRLMEIDIEDGRITDARVIGGCDGNLQGISGPLAGMEADETIRRMQGIRCGSKNTSCPDQFAQALCLYRQSHG